MDNLTHSLLGLALARCGLNRAGTGATAVLVISANAPDADIVALSGGALRYLEVHRGYTHSFLLLPLMAALSVLVTAAVMRKRLAWFPLWLLACLGVLTHLGLDWTNSYGIRLLLPFSPAWYHGDWTVLTDYVLLAVLALAAVWPSFARLVSQEIGARPGAGRGVASAALIFTCSLLLVRYVCHARATNELNSRLYEGEVPMAVAALPHGVTPLQWTAMVELPDSFRSFELTLGRDSDPAGGRVIYKPAVDAALQAASATEPFRFFRYFARFPAWSEERVAQRSGDATRVELSDLRCGAPGAGSFHCVAVIAGGGGL